MHTLTCIPHSIILQQRENVFHFQLASFIFINTLAQFIVHNSSSELPTYYFFGNMKMKEKAIIFLFMLLFASISSLPSTVAVPSSRRLKSITGETRYDQNLYHEFQERKERMDVEIADYSGTGANNHHDPRSPPGSF